MDKKVILEQCKEIEDLVSEATHNEEVARTDVEKYQGIKENNTILLGILNTAKGIYQELERTLRIIEIDKEYDNTGDELENLKVKVDSLIENLKDSVEKLKIYDVVTDTVDFYNSFIDEASNTIKTSSEDTVDFNFSDDSDDGVFDIESFDDGNAEESSATLESSDDTIDFSNLYEGNDTVEKAESHEEKESLQKVVDVADFSDKVKSTEDVSETEDDSQSINELNDLFNYLNDDSSFSA